MHLLNSFAKAVATQQNLDSRTVFNGFLQKLCVAIRKANAKATLRRGAISKAPAGPVRSAMEASVELELEPDMEA